MLVHVLCDHPACGRIQRIGMTEQAIASAQSNGWRNVPPCPACGRRYHFRQATAEEVKAAPIVHT